MALLPVRLFVGWLCDCSRYWDYCRARGAAGVQKIRSSKVLSVRSLTRLAQDEEPGLCCREVRSRGGLGMTGKNAVARTRFTCRAQRGASDVSRRGTSLVRDRS